MELESSALEVASKHWRENSNDILRKTRNKNRQLQREKSKLLLKLEISLGSEMRWRKLAVHLQNHLLNIRHTLREISSRSF